MIHRQPGPIKRFLTGFFKRVLLLVLACFLYVTGSFLYLRITAANHAITVEGPEEPVEVPVQPPDSLRLCTYNIAHGRGGVLNALNTEGGTPEQRTERLVQIGERLKDLRLDLVVLNEVDFNTWWSYGQDQARIIAEAAEFPYILKQRNLDTGVPGIRRYCFGNVLLSRFPIEEAERIRLPAFSEFENLVAGNHDAFLARVRIGKDRVIAVIGAHLEVRSEDTRVRAAGELIRVQRETKLPLILMGDLNSTPSRFPDTKVSATGQNAIEILDSFGRFIRRPVRGRASPETFTFPSAAPRRIIDWILPDANWSFMQYGVLQSVPYSDHLPVYASIRWR